MALLLTHRLELGLGVGVGLGPTLTLSAPAVTEAGHGLSPLGATPPPAAAGPTDETELG